MKRLTSRSALIRSFAIATLAAAAVLFIVGAIFIRPIARAQANPCLNAPVQVVTDPAGDQNPGQPSQLDITAVSAGEDYQYSDSPRLVFVLKVSDLNSVPANGIWRVRWTYTNTASPAVTTTYYVAMLADGSSNVRYEYGTQSGSTVTPAGSIEGGSFSKDGTITMSIARSKVGSPPDGAQLTSVNGVTQSNVGGTLFAGVDSTSSTASYTIRPKAAECTPVPLPTPTPQPIGGTAPGMPRFINYTPPATAPYNGGEPSLGANWQTGNAMYLASFAALRINFDDCPSPARDTWTNTNVPAAVSLDPILFTDHIRAVGDKTPNRTFVSQLTGQDSITLFTDNDGVSYSPSQGGGIPSGVDHQTIGAGPYHQPFVANPVYPNAVYYCSQDIATAFCARSDDGGVTFNAGVPIYAATQCTGIHGHVKVAPDGTVYVPNRSCSGKASVIVSKDNGVTWAVKPAPDSSTTGFLVDPSVGIGTNNVGKPSGQASNTIYLGYQAANGHARIAVSHDQGDTWVNDKDVSGPAGVVNATFPEVVAGDDNRAAYAFFGTTVGGNYTDQANYPQDAPWHLYIATTFDGGATWTTTDATPNDPVQRGSICNLGTTSCNSHSPNDRNLLDFMDATVDAQGRTMVGYPDGCVGACVNNPTGAHPNSYTALASIARQSGGQRLFAANDPNPPEPVVPAAPRVDGAIKDGSGVVHLKWSAPDNGGSPLTGYNVYRRTSTGTFGTPLATVPAGVTSYDDATTDPSVSYLYAVTAINSIGESLRCGEFPITAPPPIDPCSLPGVLVVDDPLGDQTLAPSNADLDVQSVLIAEPFQTDGVDRVIFTMKVAKLDTIQPNRQWLIVWTPPTAPTTAGTDRYYVAMKSNAGGAGSVSYDFGVVTSNGNVPISLGTPDAGSFTAGGVIQIAIAKNKIGSPTAGSKFTLVSARNFAGSGNGTITKSSAIDSTADGNYTLVGNAACKPNSAPLAALSANPTSGIAPLTVNFSGQNSSDPDAGDTIVSYTFDFGDGSQPVTQSTPTISHTYNSTGDFAARLTVTDSRSKTSENSASVVITVNAAPTPTPTPSATVSPSPTATATPTPTPTATPSPSPTDVKFQNISTRVLVTSGERVGIAGFILNGNVKKKVVIRALGPSLATNGTPVPGRLQDPVLELFDRNGQSIASNDNWRTNSNASEIEQSGLAPRDDREAAILTRLDPDFYTAKVSGAGGNSGIGLIEVYDVEYSSDAEARNLSTRGFVGTSDNVLIGGVIIGAGDPHRILFRAIGPELTASGVQDALQDPFMELRDANGELLYANDNWKDTQREGIESTGIAPKDDRESAILRLLGPGNYTAIVRGVGGTTGLGLVEAYNLGR